MKNNTQYQRTEQEFGVILAKPVDTKDWFPDGTQEKLDKYISNKPKTTGELLLLISQKTQKS